MLQFYLRQIDKRKHPDVHFVRLSDILILLDNSLKFIVLVRLYDRLIGRKKYVFEDSLKNQTTAYLPIQHPDESPVGRPALQPAAPPRSDEIQYPLFSVHQPDQAQTPAQHKQ